MTTASPLVRATHRTHAPSYASSSSATSGDVTHTSSFHSNRRHHIDGAPPPPPHPSPLEYRRAGSSMRRAVGLSDRRLTTLANETAAMIQWDRILRAAAPTLTRWKWLQHAGNFSLYVKHESQRYAVLAIGAVDASVHEVASLLQTQTHEQHIQRMEALLADQFKHGAYVHDVDLRDVPCDDDGGVALQHLSVKTATFTKPKLLGSHEEWCFLDATYSDASRQLFEKHMTSLPPKEVYTGKSPSKTKHLHDVVAGYCVQRESAQEATDRLGVPPTDKPPAATVHFYAELFTHKTFGLPIPSTRSGVADKAIRQRLIALATSCARLPQLVRRKRLGVQVLIDTNRVFPPSNVPCVGCDKTLLLAKLCRLCGNAVCDHCSRKYDRETRSRASTRLRIENVRVCHACMETVNATDYSNLGDGSLLPPAVVPDKQSKHNKPPVANVLSSLLQDALLQAPTREKKESVMNVIRCVLGQENDNMSMLQCAKSAASSVASSTHSTPKSVRLTPTSTDMDYVHALRDLQVPTVLYTEAPVAAAAGRPYPMVDMKAPVPDNEEQRLKAIDHSHIRDLGKSEELGMICKMVAKELGCFASLVTVVGQDDLYIAASNIESLEQQSFPRDDAFCAHIIMSDEPLIVYHPEADVRFHASGSVKILGVRYYCGFPLIADDTVIGSVCAVDQKSRELSEYAYAYLKKLAETASKVVKHHADQRKRKFSAASDQRSEPRSEPQPTD